LIKCVWGRNISESQNVFPMQELIICSVEKSTLKFFVLLSDMLSSVKQEE